MKDIKQLLAEINLKEGRQREFDAFNILDDNIKELFSRVEKLEAKNLKYFARATRITDLSLGVSGVIAFPATVYPQYGNMHDDTNNNDKIFIRRNGVYNLSGGVEIDVDALSTYHKLSLVLTRGGVASFIAGQRQTINKNVHMELNVACSYYLYRDDYIQLHIDFDAGFGFLILGTPYTFLAVNERMEDLDPGQFGLLPPIEGK